MISRWNLLKLYGYEKNFSEELLRTVWTKDKTFIFHTDVQRLKVKELRELLRKKECEFIKYKNGIPVLKPIKTTDVHWYILCPYCGEKHWHGVDNGVGGHRLSHCIERKPNDHGYYIEP